MKRTVPSSRISARAANRQAPKYLLNHLRLNALNAAIAAERTVRHRDFILPVYVLLQS